MLYVSVQLWPNGDKAKSREIGHVAIWNESGLADNSDYGYDLLQSASTVTVSPAVRKRGYISKFRRREYGVMELLHRILSDATADRSVFDPRT
jgi:hypothetical protein